MRLKCKSGEYELSTTIMEAYAAIYPTADQEFARMVIWLESNPSRRPASAKSAPRFIANWFKRVPKRVQTKVDQRADTVRQLVGDMQRLYDRSYGVPFVQPMTGTFAPETPRDPSLPWCSQ